MGKYRRLHPGPQGPAKGRQGVLPVEEPPSADHKPGLQRVKGPGHRVVFKAGHRHRGARLHKTADGYIQAVGAASGEDRLLRPAVKELCRLLPAAEDLPGRGLRRFPPRPGLAQVRKAASMALTTPGGLGKEVAP